MTADMFQISVLTKVAFKSYTDEINVKITNVEYEDFKKWVIIPHQRTEKDIGFSL